MPFFNPTSAFQGSSLRRKFPLSPPFWLLLVGGSVLLSISSSSEGRRGYVLNSSCSSADSSRAAKGPLCPAAATVPGLGLDFVSTTGGFGGSDG